MTHFPPPLERGTPQPVVPLAYETSTDDSWRRAVRLLLILSILYSAAAVTWKALWFSTWFRYLSGGGQGMGAIWNEHWLALGYLIGVTGSVLAAGAALIIAVFCLRAHDLSRALCILMLTSTVCALAGSIAQSLYLMLKHNIPAAQANLATSSLGMLCHGMFPLAVTLLLWPRGDDPLKRLFERTRT